MSRRYCKHCWFWARHGNANAPHHPDCPLAPLGQGERMERIEKVEKHNHILGSDTMPGDWVHLDVERIVMESDAAFLVRLEDDEGEFWVPKSLVSDADDYSAGDQNATLSVAAWWARKEGLV